MYSFWFGSDSRKLFGTKNSRSSNEYSRGNKIIYEDACRQTQSPNSIHQWSHDYMLKPQIATQVLFLLYLLMN